MIITSYILVITLKVNGLVHQSKEIDWMGGWKHTPNCM